ncbi:MAG: glycosyltransferase, partial [Thermoplasmata archaeon]
MTPILRHGKGRGKVITRLGLREAVLVSVLVTARNEEHNIADLLDSLVTQEAPLEIIVVDSSSEDR